MGNSAVLRTFSLPCTHYCQPCPELPGDCFISSGLSSQIPVHSMLLLCLSKSRFLSWFFNLESGKAFSLFPFFLFLVINTTWWIGFSGTQTILFWLFLIGNAEFFFFKEWWQKWKGKGEAALVSQFSKKGNGEMILHYSWKYVLATNGVCYTLKEWRLPVFT